MFVWLGSCCLVLMSSARVMDVRFVWLLYVIMVYHKIFISRLPNSAIGGKAQ